MLTGVLTDNAYVSGMREDLELFGNELVQLQTMYTVGAVVGQLPFMLLMTRIPMHWLLPFLDIAWGIFTLLQYRATSFAEMMAYRFLVGWFEAAFYPITQYIFGSWYRVDEIGRRAGTFYVGSTLGAMTAGFLQAAASQNLHGVRGLAGWRWMYIICAVITIPVGIIGYFVLPGTPDRPNPRIMKPRDVEVAVARLRRAGHETVETFSFAALRSISKKAQFWILLAMGIFFWNSGAAQGTGAFLLWLRSLDRFSIPHVNQIGAAQPALGMFYTLILSFSSDLFLGPMYAIVLGQTYNAIGLLILTIWDVPEPAKWFAFLTNFSASSVATCLYAWVNHALRESPAERSAAIIAMSMIGQSTTAWTPILTFPTTEAPRFPKGFPFALACALILIVLALVLGFVWNKPVAKDESSSDEEDHSMSDTIEPLLP